MIYLLTDYELTHFCIIKIELGNKNPLSNVNHQRLDPDLQPIELLQLFIDCSLCSEKTKQTGWPSGGFLH